MSTPKLTISIQVMLDDSIYSQREAESFEIAEQDLDSLKRDYEKAQALAEDQMEAQLEEDNN